MTQRELAALLKCDYTYLSKIENDKVDQPPSASFIRQLAYALDADPDQLMDLANQFDRRALREVTKDMPEAAALFRRIQRREISREELIRFLDQAGKSKPTDADKP